jgi:mycothiol synthase
MNRLFEPGERILVPELDSDYSLVHDLPNWEQKWIDILNESADFGKWDLPKLSRVLFSDMLPSGGVLVVDKWNKPVACSAACLKKGFEPLGVLMNVAVLPNYRGQGISQTMVAEVLATCHRQGIPGVTLLTDDFRFPAIKLYLNLGFKPDMTMSLDASNRWERVFAQLEGYKK